MLGWMRFRRRERVPDEAPRVVFATTIPLSAIFLSDVYRHFGSRIETFLLSGADGGNPPTALREWPTHRARFGREMSPLRDILGLIDVVRILRTIKPDIVVYGTPKASLIVSLGSLIVGVRSRYFILHGLRHQTLTGVARWLMWASDYMASRTADRTIAVSPSLRNEAINCGIANSREIEVWGAGSLCGIDSTRFSPLGQKSLLSARRKELGYSTEAFILGFVGRLGREKGLTELLEAFNDLRGRHDDLGLLLVGDHDDTDPLPASVLVAMGGEGVRLVGHVDDVVPYLQCMDAFVLPTWREGLGLASLEAAACGIPVVTTHVVGAVDTVVGQETGLLVPPRDPVALSRAIEILITDRQRATSMGVAGRRFVEQSFSPWERMENWETLLQANEQSAG